MAAVVVASGEGKVVLSSAEGMVVVVEEEEYLCVFCEEGVNCGTPKKNTETNHPSPQESKSPHCQHKKINNPISSLSLSLCRSSSFPTPYNKGPLNPSSMYVHIYIYIVGKSRT